MTELSQLVIAASQLIAAVLLIYGLKQMSSPMTARSGIFVAGLGMLAAVVTTFLYVGAFDATAHPRLWANLPLALGALALGAGMAWWSGKRVAMTSMPQMIALFNGMGGGAAGAIAAVELFGGSVHGTTALTVTLLGALIGAVSLSGSLVAWAKLDGVIKKPLHLRGQQLGNAAVFLATVAVGAYVAVGTVTDNAPLLQAPHAIGAATRRLRHRA